jgi:transketolase
MGSWAKGMRNAFFDTLFVIARKNKEVILLTADIGAICHDKFKQLLPKQYINVGIAEQHMVGLSAGLALSGKIVYIYSIIPFLAMRCYEQIRVDICCMNISVKIVGIGAGFDYSTLGPTHHGTEDIALMRSLPNLTIYSPSDNLLASKIAQVSFREQGPAYIRLDRTGHPPLYKTSKEINMQQGLSILRKGRQLYIITTGNLVYTALKVSEELSKYSIDVGVIDLFRLKPINEERFLNAIKGVPNIAVLEEHCISGGIGEKIAAIISSKMKKPPRLKLMGITDQFCREYGRRESLRRVYNLDVSSIFDIVLRWIKE